MVCIMYTLDNKLSTIGTWKGRKLTMSMIPYVWMFCSSAFFLHVINLEQPANIRVRFLFKCPLLHTCQLSYIGEREQEMPVYKLDE